MVKDSCIQKIQDRLFSKKNAIEGYQIPNNSNSRNKIKTVKLQLVSTQAVYNNFDESSKTIDEAYG